MFAQERQQRILQNLREQGKVTVEQLVGEFGVSAPTIRADLAALEARRLLRRAHGGAIVGQTSHHEPPYAERAQAQASEKRRIGRAAAALIAPGETVLLDAGTTCYEVALALADGATANTGDITVVTNNLPAATVLSEIPGISTIVIGGQIQPRRRATLGPLAADFLAPIRADRLFLGVSGVDAQAGLSAADFEAAHVKQAMLRASAFVAVLADSTKIGQRAFARIAPVSVAHLLLTDTDLQDEPETTLLEAGLPEIRRV